jgi:hypothetical protein
VGGEPNEEQQPSGGPAVIGVASFSKARSIREFNKKDHYNLWQFVYDPSTDHAGLITAPNQPLPKGTVQVQPLTNGNGVPPSSGLAPSQPPLKN